MPYLPGETRLPEAPPDLLSQAAAILSREALRLPATAPGATTAPPHAVPGSSLPGVGGDLGAFAGRVCPVTGAAVPLPGADKDRLRQQAHELLAGILGT